MRQSTLVLVENDIVRQALPRDVAERAFVFQRALLSDTAMVPARDGRRTHDIVFPSTLNGRKGGMLALEAIAMVPEPFRLVFVNEGPDEPRLRRRAEELGLTHRVRFLGRIPRQEYFALTKGAAMAVFAGINEDGGCALCETMLLGTPVVVLAHSGPKEICHYWSTDPDRVALVEPAGSIVGTVQALGAAMVDMIGRAPTRTDPYLDRDRAIHTLRQLYGYAMVEHAQSVHLPPLAAPVPA